MEERGKGGGRKRAGRGGEMRLSNMELDKKGLIQCLAKEKKAGRTGEAGRGKERW